MTHDAETEPTITLAGNRITCPRCQAKSKRSGQQCKKPALRGRRVCQIHGGRSRGPQTAEGKANSAAANLKSGEFSKAAAARNDRSCALLAILEDAIHLLEMVPSGTPRTPGRKPKLHIPVTSREDILQSILALRD